MAEQFANDGDLEQVVADQPLRKRPNLKLEEPSLLMSGFESGPDLSAENVFFLCRSIGIVKKVVFTPGGEGTAKAQVIMDSFSLRDRVIDALDGKKIWDNKRLNVSTCIGNVVCGTDDIIFGQDEATQAITISQGNLLWVQLGEGEDDVSDAVGEDDATGETDAAGRADAADKDQQNA